LICEGSKTGTKHYDFNITVKNQPFCGLPGVFSGTSDCGVPGFTDTISAVDHTNESDVNDVRFANFGGRGIAVTGTATCSSGNLSLPYQSVGNDTYVNGQGTFTATGSVTIYYTMVISGVSHHCQFTLERQ
jgi:hypothetical protein